MIKVDGCNACGSLYAEGYKTFGWYMNHTTRPMLYSCSWPAYIPTKKAIYLPSYFVFTSEINMMKLTISELVATVWSI